jgi:hypothetical protein
VPAVVGIVAVAIAHASLARDWLARRLPEELDVGLPPVAGCAGCGSSQWCSRRQHGTYRRVHRRSHAGLGIRVPDRAGEREPPVLRGNTCAPVSSPPTGVRTCGTTPTTTLRATDIYASTAISRIPYGYRPRSR